MKLFKRMRFILKFWKLIPFLKDFFLAKEVAGHKKTLGFLMVVTYAFFPFDLIPDFVGIIGLVDDLAVAAFVADRIIAIAPESLKVKHGLQTN